VVVVVVGTATAPGPSAPTTPRGRAPRRGGPAPGRVPVEAARPRPPLPPTGPRPARQPTVRHRASVVVAVAGGGVGPAARARPATARRATPRRAGPRP